MLDYRLTEDIRVEDPLRFETSNSFSFELILHLSARKLRIAPHRARLPDKKEVKVTTHIVRVPLWLLRTDDMIIFTSKKRFIFIAKKIGRNTTNWWQLTAVVGWPAIFAPGCHTSRNQPARKKKEKLEKIHMIKDEPDD